MMTEFIPGYVTNDVYDVVRNRVAKLEKSNEEKDDRIAQLEEACTKMTVENTFRKAEVQEGQAKLADAEIMKKLIFDLLKQKPRELVIKYRGSTVIEIQPKG